jgi:hypothetical protein
VALVEASTDQLAAETAEMVRCDDAHEEELRDDPEARARRDAACDKVHDALVTVREQLTTICGAAYVAKLGFDAPTPVSPVEVLRLGTTVVTNLEETPPPAPLVPGYQVDPELWRAPLAALVERLDGITSAVAAEKKEAEATLVAKHAAIEGYDRTFSETANLVSVLLAVAGEKELAKRVRPSSRRPGQTAENAPAAGSIAASERASLAR